MAKIIVENVEYDAGDIKRHTGFDATVYVDLIRKKTTISVPNMSDANLKKALEEVQHEPINLPAATTLQEQYAQATTEAQRIEVLARYLGAKQ